jgi:acetyl esterase/lipase
VRLSRVMREGGAVVDLRVWEGLWHVFEFYPDIPEADLSLTEIADFLRPRL